MFTVSRVTSVVNTMKGEERDVKFRSVIIISVTIWHFRYQRLAQGQKWKMKFEYEYGEELQPLSAGAHGVSSEKKRLSSEEKKGLQAW
jgi:hypothetical protein